MHITQNYTKNKNIKLTCSVSSRLFTILRKTASAVGDRHMLPAKKYTSKTNVMLNRQNFKK